MTDARDAEAAARELAMGFREGYASAWVMSGALDAYRDAIEARVREEMNEVVEHASTWGHSWEAEYHKAMDERDAEVRALVEAVRGFDAFIQMVDSGMTVFPLDPEHEDSELRAYERVLANLRTALKHFEEGAGGLKHNFVPLRENTDASA